MRAKIKMCTVSGPGENRSGLPMSWDPFSDLELSAGHLALWEPHLVPTHVSWREQPPEAEVPEERLGGWSSTVRCLDLRSMLCPVPHSPV